MPKVTFNVTEDELVELQNQAQGENLTVTEYVRGLVFPNRPSDPPINFLVAKVHQEVSKLSVGTHFSIPDFFQRAYWRQLGKGTRLNVGKEFKRQVDNNEVQDVAFVKKTSSNWAVYKKTN